MSDDERSRRKMVWNHALAVDMSAIDAQHALLYALANRLLDHPEALARDELVVDILTDLGRFLILHFKTEEALMKELGMPKAEIEKHMHAHNVIIDQYADLNLAAARGKHHTAAEIFGLVKQWVGNHLEADDLQLRNYLPASR